MGKETYHGPLEQIDIAFRHHHIAKPDIGERRFRERSDIEHAAGVIQAAASLAIAFALASAAPKSHHAGGGTTSSWERVRPAFERAWSMSRQSCCMRRAS